MGADMNSIVELINELLDDRTIPKNVRTRIEEIKMNLEDEQKEEDVKLGTSITIMDEVSNDPNLPVYARTKIWNIVSMMESARSKNN